MKNLTETYIENIEYSSHNVYEWQHKAKYRKIEFAQKKTIKESIDNKFDA